MSKITKIIIAIVLLLPLGLVQAQSIQKLKAVGQHAKYSDDGKTVIVSKNQFSSIEKFDLELNKQTVLAEGRGVGYKTFIDGDEVFFNKNKETKSVNIKTGKKNKVKAGITVKASVMSKKLGKKSANSVVDAIPSDDIQSITLVYGNGNVKQVAPRGNDGIYVLISLSPNGKFVLYNGVSGTDVYNIATKEVVSIGVMDAPKWAGNDVIVYMKTEDDGHVITKSDVCTYNLKTKKSKNVTKQFNGIAQYPSANDGATKILFSTEKNEVYQIINK